MKTPTLSISLAAVLALAAAGCSSADYTNPNNTTKGAAVGAATGAALGGIVGHQSGETGSGAAVGAVVGGIAGAAIGHRNDQRDAAAAARVGDTAYTVQTVPPAPTSQPYETMPPQPASNSVWVRGHYEYTGTGYQWVAGRWEIPPTGMHTWVEPTWQPAQGGGYVYTRGHWQ